MYCRRKDSFGHNLLLIEESSDLPNVTNKVGVTQVVTQ